MKHSLHLTASILVLLAALTLWAYWGVGQNDFVEWDDHDYVVHNPHVRKGLTAEGVIWAFTSFHSSNWHPLTWISHMVDCELFGLNPGGHHRTSLLLHLVNTLLLFLAFRKITGAARRSALVAALFALHPLHVESVAWVAERKDVLSGFFFMAALLAYTGYCKEGGTGRFLLTFFLYTLGLLSKPMVVTFPFVLLLLDYWPLQRFRERRLTGRSGWWALLPPVREKVPFFLLSALSSLVTFYAQRDSGALVSTLPLGTRLANALVSYVRYMVKTLLPLDLGCFYPHPADGIETWQVAGAFVLLAAITGFAIRSARTHPYLLVGWLWFVGTLVPVIGLIQVGEQAMADRYTYLPLIGLLLILAWGVPELAGRRKPIAFLVPGAWVLILFAMVFLTRMQVTTWKNTVSLLEQGLRVTRDNFLVHFHLAGSLERQGRIEEAHRHLSESLRIRPDFWLGLQLMGKVASRQGRGDEAIGYYQRAIEIHPQDHKTLTNMGFVLLGQNRLREAADQFSEALRINPEDRIARHNLDIALRRLERAGNP